MKKKPKKSRSSYYWFIILFTILLLVIVKGIFLTKHKQDVKQGNDFNTQTTNLLTTDEYNLTSILANKDLIWLYSNRNKQCLFGSYRFEHADDDRLQGWRFITKDNYKVEPINIGEGPIWFIKNIKSVRWSGSNGLCKIGIEMDLQEGNDPYKHVWYILEFNDAYVSGRVHTSLPDIWNALIEGDRLK